MMSGGWDQRPVYWKTRLTASEQDKVRDELLASISSHQRYLRFDHDADQWSLGRPQYDNGGGDWEGLIVKVEKNAAWNKEREEHVERTHVVIHPRLHGGRYGPSVRLSARASGPLVERLKELREGFVDPGVEAVHAATALLGQTPGPAPRSEPEPAPEAPAPGLLARVFSIVKRVARED